MLIDDRQRPLDLPDRVRRRVVSIDRNRAATARRQQVDKMMRASPVLPPVVK